MAVGLFGFSVSNGIADYYSGGKIILSVDLRSQLGVRSVPRIIPDTDDKIFVGAKLKIDRAKEHIEEAARVFEHLLVGDAVSVFETRDQKTNERVAYVQMRKQLPIRFSACVGDALSNIRSSLDLLVCELVRMNGNMTTRENAFPFFQNATQCEALRLQSNARKGVDRLAGVSCKARRLITALRPYPDGNKLLNLINKLRNRDNHQDYTPAVAAAPVIEVEVASPNFLILPNGNFGIGFGHVPEGAQPFSPGAGTPVGFKTVFPITDEPIEVFRCDPAFMAKVIVDLAPVFKEPDFVEGKPIIALLVEMYEAVVRILWMAEQYCI